MSDMQTELTQELETLRRRIAAGDEPGGDALGFYTVMAVMANAAGIAELMQAGDDAGPLVRNRVLHFATALRTLLASAFPEVQDQEQLAQMARMGNSAMKVPFEFKQARMAISSDLVALFSRDARIGQTSEARALQQELQQAVRTLMSACLPPP